MPAFWNTDKTGVPGPMQRVHWDEHRARDLGLPAPYDYGRMRLCWLTHLVTNWIGDDGWLLSISNELRGFNFIGDTTICTGEVVRKRIEGPHHIVDLDIRATNQNGDVTSPGTASVILPSREAGDVILPIPPENLRIRGTKAVSRQA